ncbi:MAG: hypothetical protein K2W80_02525 [Burkholderiales bacterium]|nr:hypothetical protein [Burkholderiales bacterium]
MLDHALLRDFCSKFYGYGNPLAQHWFISMEEGGGNTEQELERRLVAWRDRGCRDLEDVSEYHRAIRQDEWFGPHPKIQRTWAAMIRVELAWGGLSTDVESVRRYQRDHLGRTNGSTRLSPLLPLPSKSLDHWHYPAWTADHAFLTRSRYRDEFLAVRVAHLAQALSVNQPRTVTFLGLSCLPQWQRIAGNTPLVPSELGHVGKSGQTTFVVCTHPAVKGVKNEYFVAVGRHHRDS